MNRFGFAALVTLAVVASANGMAQEKREKSFVEMSAEYREQLEKYYPHDPEKRERMLEKFQQSDRLRRAAQRELVKRAQAAASAARDPRNGKMPLDDLRNTLDLEEKIRLGTAPVRRPIDFLPTLDDERLRKRGQPESDGARILWNLAEAKKRLEHKAAGLVAETWFSAAFAEVLDKLKTESAVDKVLRDTFVRDIEKLERELMDGLAREAQQADSGPQGQGGLLQALQNEYRRLSTTSSQPRSEPLIGGSSRRLRDLLKRLGDPPPRDGIDNVPPKRDDTPKTILN